MGVKLLLWDLGTAPMVNRDQSDTGNKKRVKEFPSKHGKGDIHLPSTIGKERSVLVPRNHS